MAKSANTAMLYLPQKMGGLNLPALTSVYKRLQVSRQCQLLTSPDGCVRLMAERNLQHELMLTWKKFKPAVCIRDAMADDPSQSRKALSSAAKWKVKEEDDYNRLTRLTSLEKQGQILATSADEEAEVWSKTIQTLPSEQMRFVLNAAVDALPHNANLQLWRERDSHSCAKLLQSCLRP